MANRDDEGFNIQKLSTVHVQIYLEDENGKVFSRDVDFGKDKYYNITTHFEWNRSVVKAFDDTGTCRDIVPKGDLNFELKVSCTDIEAEKLYEQAKATWPNIEACGKQK